MPIDVVYGTQSPSPTYVNNRGVRTGPADLATAGPKFPEPTIKNTIPLFVIKQL